MSVNCLQVGMNAAELSRRRDVVCRWFGLNRIPVARSADDTISVANGVLTINAPYNVEDCYSSNEIILARVRTLLTSLPTDDNISA